jgi:hypothetical protein
MEDPNSQDQPSTGGPAARQQFIRELLEKAGGDGASTKQIADAVITAGLCARRQTVSEDLSSMRDVGLMRVGEDARWYLVTEKVPDTVPDGWEHAHGDEDRADEGGMVLAIPFVVCTSEGGPFDDEAFVSGVQVGEVMATLRTLKALDAAGSGRFWVDKKLQKQLDLVAMHYGYDTDVEEVDGPEFEGMCWVSFAKSDPV